MTVGALDVGTASETLLDRVYEIMARCHAEAAPAEPYRSRSEAEAFLRHPPELEARDDEPAVWDVARVRDLEAALERRNRDVRVTVALDEQGDVVAFTELRVSRATGSLANTEDTAVVRDRRRRGLGFWVKLESLRRLEQERPDGGLVTTTNAEQNDAILRVNRALGFSPVAVHTTCVLRV